MKQLQQLASLLQKPKNSEELIDLLHDLLTPEEITTLHQRLEIVSMLLKGVSQRDIATKLDCGIATVTRGSRIIKHGTGAIQKLLS